MHLVQQTPEWHKFRKTHIGSSDIASIVGLSPWKTLYELWLEKTGRVEPEEPTYPMLRGIALEEEARAAYIKHTTIMVMPDVLIHPDRAFCSASLDGITFDGLKIVEIKCPLGDETYDLAAGASIIQAQYACQIQWQLLISNAESCDFWVYVPGKPPALLTVTPDKDTQKHLFDAAVAFWDFVINDVEPEKPEDAPIMVVTPEFAKAAGAWKAANLRLKEAQQEEKLAKAALIDETDGGNSVGSGVKIERVDDAQCVDWAAVKENFNLTDAVLAPYTKKKAPYFRVSLLKDKDS